VTELEKKESVQLVINGTYKELKKDEVGVQLSNVLNNRIKLLNSRIC